jgi:outer membrane protein
VLALSALMAAGAGAQTNLAILNVQEAISRTGEGQKLIRELEQKYQPARQRLESKNQRVQGMREQLQKGANTMSAEAQRNLNRDIQRAEVDLKREMEDARGEFSQEQNQLFNAVGSKMMVLIDQYSKDNGLQIVLDISNPQSPVLYAVNEINITNAIIEAYDAEHPVDAGASTE